MAKDNASIFLKDTFMKTVKNRIEEAETEAEAKEVIEKLEKIDLSDLFKEMLFKMADDTTQYMKKTMYEEVMAFRAGEEEFIVRQEQKWYRGFVASEAMYIMTLEVAESYVQYVNDLSIEEKIQNNNTFLAMYISMDELYKNFLKLLPL